MVTCERQNDYVYGRGVDRVCRCWWSLHLSFVIITGKVLKNICSCILNDLSSTTWFCNLCLLGLVLGGKRTSGSSFSCRKHPGFITKPCPFLPEFPHVFPASPPSRTLPKSLSCLWSENVTDTNVAAVYKMLNYSWYLSTENPRAELT